MKCEISRLVDAWLQGDLSDEDFTKFEKLLAVNPDARQLLRLEVNLDMVLREHASLTAGLMAWSGEADSPKKIIKRPSQWRSWKALAVAASVAVTLSGGAFLWGSKHARNQQLGKEEMNLGCAILTKVVNAEWLDGGSAMRVGDTLKAGNLKLACGFAQIEFFSGATLLLEGDAEIEIVSPSEVICHSGKARVRVPPPARGFQLHAPDLKLVDLGTEFGVQVNPEDLSSEVHVFEGEVEAFPNNHQLISLKGGQGLRKTGDDLQHLPYIRPDDFMCMEVMDGISAARANVRFDAWSGWENQATDDSRLLAFYAFKRSTKWERLLSNSAGPEKFACNGGIVGARWTQGRWPMKDALEFKRPGDRVRIQVKGEYEGLTFSCWVKVDGLDRKYNALLLTDGYEPGEPHWQILQDGRVMFSIAYPQSDNADKLLDQVYYSPVIFTRSNLGRWHHLAVTYDNCSGEAIQFVDGKKVSHDSSELYQPGRKIVYGSCELGNWGLPAQGHQFPIRNLNGCLDEFSIYNTALTQTEVRKMYEAGKQE